MQTGLLLRINLVSGAGFLSFSASPSTDSSLLRRVQDRDPAAWRAWAELYGPLIYAWARRSGLPTDDAADVTQETFSAAARGIRDFQPDGDGALRGWLWTVTMNKVRDHVRRQPRNARAVGGSEMHLLLQQLPAYPPSFTADSAAARDAQALVHRAMAQIAADFEPVTWHAFRRLMLDGVDAAAVAAECGLTVNNLRQIRFRVLRRLREQLDGLSG